MEVRGCRNTIFQKKVFLVISYIFNNILNINNLNINITASADDQDLLGILKLQAKNHASVVDDVVKKSQGFVTVKHDLELLKRFHKNHPAILAKSGNKVVGYALVMEREMRDTLPVLVPMFDVFEGLSWKNRRLLHYDWFVMGQICIDRDHRGKGIFEALYEKMKTQMQPHFDFVLTEIAERNTRSIQAHEKVGFQTLHQYIDPQSGEYWRIVLWEMNNLLMF